MNSSNCRGGPTRRELLQLALRASAMFVVPPIAAIEAEAERMPFAELLEVTTGAVRPHGWLGTYLEKQATELASALPQVSWPFTEGYWGGEEEPVLLYPWEQRAYWIDGATRCALVSGDDRLLRQAQVPIHYTFANVTKTGYLGPLSLEDRSGDDRWPHTVFFRAVMALSDAVGNNGMADAMRLHYMSDNASYSKLCRNVTNIEPMLWCYRHTGDQRLVDKAERAWLDFDQQPSDPTCLCDLVPGRNFNPDSPISSHGVTYAEISKLPTLLYMQSGKQQYLDFALAAQKRIFDHHMLVDGAPSTSEIFRTTTALDSHETCDIADHTWSWGYMLMATGNGIWADRIERACLNAGFGAIRKDWKALQYFSCPNQVLATQNSNHNAWHRGNFWMAYQPNPGHVTACCGGNVHRIFPNYAIRMWMRDQEGGLAATLYGPCTVKAFVGRGKQPIEIRENTQYPFDETVNFVMNLQEPVSFPFWLRIPSWCDSPQLLINDRIEPVPSVRNGFTVLRRTFRHGDTITLVLPMRVSVSHWPDNGIALERGPLVYAMAVKEEWNSIVEPLWSTEAFPSWNATPASAWNYGLAIDENRMTQSLSVVRRPYSIDPWQDAPVSIKTPARRIGGWDLVSDPAFPGSQFTPPLPDPSRLKPSSTVEQLTLVPYGSTQLRVTIFPHVS